MKSKPRARVPLDPPPEEMRRLGYAVVDRLVEHLATLSEQPVSRTGPASELMPAVDEPLPRAGADFDQTLEHFFENVVPRMTRVNHPRFHGYIPCPSSFYATLGAWLSSGTNPFVGSWLGAGTIGALELVVLRWIAEAIGYPPDAAGVLTSGGSMANLGGLAAARTAHGQDPRSHTLYFSSEGHTSAEKAALVLGYPADSLRHLPVDEQLRLRPETVRTAVLRDLDAGLDPLLLSANAGTTNTGSIDPLDELADLCQELGLWFHVDAAYGGFAALCPEGREKLRGMERADSLTLDPHKWLYSPMGTGCLLVRDRGALETAFATHGDYLREVPRDEVNLFDRGPEMSRPGRALSVWALMRTVGVDGLARQVEADLELARLAEALLAEPPFEIVCPAELSIVTFRQRRHEGESDAERAARDDAFLKRIQDDGEVMLSSTLIGGTTALRLVVMNHRTDEAEVRRSVERIRALSR